MSLGNTSSELTVRTRGSTRARIRLSPVRFLLTYTLDVYLAARVLEPQVHQAARLRPRGPLQRSSPTHKP